MPHASVRSAVELLLEGHSPAQISQQLHRPLGAVLNALFQAVGQGRIRRSDILFSIDPAARHAMEEAITDSGSTAAPKVRRLLARKGVALSAADLNVYLGLRDARVDLGDMYEFIREIELRLHEYVRVTLIAEFGEAEWWRKGVPLPVREDCAVMNERDSEPVQSLYCYTTVMNLRHILDKEWPRLSRNLPGQFRGDKQEFLASLTRLNRIRNIVMHPVKGVLLKEEDFDFVRNLRRLLLTAQNQANTALAKAEEAELPVNSQPAEAA